MSSALNIRKPLIAGNWKLHKTIGESLELVTLLKRELASVQSVDILVCPVFTALSEVAEALSSSDIAVGAQDLFWEEKGAFTGEVSASLIKDAGARYAVIGHSERRQYFHETDETVNKKTKSAIRAGLIPIVCVGETLTERETGKTFAVIDAQLKGGLAGLTAEDLRRCVIAYEPVWAIGTGKVATPAQAQEVHAFIRKELGKVFGAESSAGIRILYGGSVKPDNTAQLLSEPDIDGALVGGASLEAASFAEVVRQASAVTVQ